MFTRLKAIFATPRGNDGTDADIRLNVYATVSRLIHFERADWDDVTTPT